MKKKKITFEGAIDAFKKNKNSGCVGNQVSYIKKLNKDGFHVMDVIENQVRKKYIKINKTIIDNPRQHIEGVMAEFEKFVNTRSYTANMIHSLRCAFKSFSIFILGQYKGNLSLMNDKEEEFEFCRLIAKYALFCTIEVADDILNGDEGCKENKKNGNKGNKFYSWFKCKFRRARHNEKRGTLVSGVKLDDNVQAGLAIKSAIALDNGFQLGNYSCFETYMACHIWDKTCYDEKYHTSVFNLVLIPSAIGGLSDYYDEVKLLLQYEASQRFRVCPKGMKPSEPKCYKKLDNYWRQMDQHEKALAAKKSLREI